MIEPSGERPIRPSRSLRILIADDDATLRRVVTLTLERRGHRVIEACSAAEALRLADRHDVDAALVDACMPGDGLALRRRLELLPELRGRTALMTGADESIAGAAVRPILTKPFDFDEMVALVERLGG